MLFKLAAEGRFSAIAASFNATFKRTPLRGYAPDGVSLNLARWASCAR